MYYSHFGLKLPPFKITSDTEFFFTGGQRGAILDALVYAISSGEGIVKVVGEVGSGKTMLCRMLQSLLPENVESVYLANPSVAPEDILHAIAFELQLPLPDNADRLHVMHALQEYLLERHSENKHVVVFIEEAQGMPLETLEEIRLLSNLETRHDKLLQIILFGQPELDVNLDKPQIRQLRERITHSFNLGPLEEKDIGDYLIFRMRTAGYFGPPLFSKGAIRKIAQASRGLVRRINILADKALLAAFAESAYAIKPKHIAVAVRDSEFDSERDKPAPKYKTWLLSMTMLCAGIFLGFVLHILATDTPPLPVEDPVINKPAPAMVDSISPPPVSQEAASPEMETDKSQIASGNDPLQPPSKDNSSLAAEAPKNEPQPTVIPPATTQLPLQPQWNLLPTPQSTEPPKDSTPQAIPPMPAAAPVSTDILEARLLATQQWLGNQPDTTVSIQILGTPDEQYVRHQLKALGTMVDGEQLFVYRHIVGGNPYLTVNYGSYPDRQSARKALADLPSALKMFHPRLRTVAGIRKDIK